MQVNIFYGVSMFLSRGLQPVVPEPSAARNDNFSVLFLIAKQHGVMILFKLTCVLLLNSYCLYLEGENYFVALNCIWW